MGNKGIKFIVYAISICILYAVLNYLNTRDNTDKNPGQNELHYIVKTPSVLKSIYFSIFLFGIILFCVFLFFKLKGNPTVTNGHLWFALVFAAIGLVIMFFATRWRIIVNENEMEIHHLFRSRETLLISEIEKAETGDRGQIEIFKNGKIVTTVDGLVDNYGRFKKTLGQYGKLK